MVVKGKSFRRSFKKGMVKSKRTKQYKSVNPSKVHLFRRLGQITRISNSSVAAVTSVTGGIEVGAASGPNNFGYDFGASMKFRLSDTENSSELTALYDRYKITGVKVKIIPLSNTASAGGLSYLPELMYTFDTDDSSVPTETVMRQKCAKTKRLDKPVSIFIKPRVAGTLWQNALASGYSIAPNTYINCSTPSVEYYGLKLYFKNVDLRSTSTVATQFNIETTYYLAMKDPQ
jgi:hypothetical protein